MVEAQSLRSISTFNRAGFGTGKPGRTKGDITGFCDSDTETESDESIEISDIKPNVKFLPATVDGLGDRFNQQFTEFMWQGKHEHRNELVFLLNELLRQNGKTKTHVQNIFKRFADAEDEEHIS